MSNKFKFKGIIEEATRGGAIIRVPIDIKKEYNKGRLKVNVTFDDEPYKGSIVNMGLKNDDGSTCYIIGILKDIRKKINKNIGDEVEVVVEVLSD